MKRKIGVGLVAIVLAMTSSAIMTSPATAAQGIITQWVNGVRYIHEASVLSNNISVKSRGITAHRVAAEIRAHSPGGGGTTYRGWVYGSREAIATTPSGHFFNGGRTKAGMNVNGETVWAPNNNV